MSTLSGTSSTTRISGGSRMSLPEKKTLHRRKNTSPQRSQRTHKGHEGLKAIEHPHDAVAHVRDMKIQQITEPEASEPKVTEKLTAMDRKDRLDRLEFDNHPIADEQVDAIAIVDRQIFVTDRDHDLSAYGNSLLLEFVKQASLVRALKQAWPND